MDAEQILPEAPKYVVFRVLIIGRANAGKTSILQRVCDTTESPEIYSSGARKPVQLEPSMERGEHDIELELRFSSHKGYVFHDSRGFEAGDDRELKIVQEFVRRRSREVSLNGRLHAIWYCIPMDNDRPSLDLKYIDDICPDKNVPVIAVFTKYDQFRREVKMKLEDQYPDSVPVDDDVESIFKKHFLSNLEGSAPFVRLEKMNKPGKRCTDLISKTASSLSNVVTLMLLAVQKDNLELNINYAVKWVHSAFEEGSGSTETVIKLCVLAFPSIWYYLRLLLLGGLREELLLLLGEGLLLPEQADGFMRTDNEFKIVFSKLSSFLANPPCLTTGDDTHHVLIAVTIILEHACLIHASELYPTADDALDRAYSRYRSSDFHIVVTEQFSASATQYSPSQFIEFILDHRL